MGILKDLELKHGGVHRHRTQYGTNARGGDKFNLHDYEDFYLKYIPKDPKVVVEVGVLTGTSLRVWSDYWPKARIIGLDKYPEDVVDPGRAEVYYFDQLKPSGISEILKDDRIDLCIDDGLHTVESQIRTYKYFKPYVDGVYIIEDIEKGFDMTSRLDCIQEGRIACL